MQNKFLALLKLLHEPHKHYKSLRLLLLNKSERLKWGTKKADFNAIDLHTWHVRTRKGGTAQSLQQVWFKNICFNEANSYYYSEVMAVWRIGHNWVHSTLTVIKLFVMYYIHGVHGPSLYNNMESESTYLMITVQKLCAIKPEIHKWAWILKVAHKCTRNGGAVKLKGAPLRVIKIARIIITNLLLTLVIRLNAILLSYVTWGGGALRALYKAWWGSAQHLTLNTGRGPHNYCWGKPFRKNRGKGDQASNNSTWMAIYFPLKHMHIPVWSWSWHLQSSREGEMCCYSLLSWQMPVLTALP